jgi:hypothetical protein
MAVGVGNADVAMSVSMGPCPRGAEVPFSVELKGGVGTQKVDCLTAKLIEFWVTGTGKNRSHHRRTVAAAVLAKEIVVGEGDLHTFEGALLIPDTVRCSRRREGCLIHVEADIPLAVNPRVEGVLKVVPQAEILAVQRAARDQFGLRQQMWDGANPEVYYRFEFNSGRVGDYDGVALKIAVQGATLEGAVHFIRRPTGITALFTSLTGGNIVSVPVSIPRSELRTKRGSPNPAGAVPWLQAAWDAAGCPRG